MIDIQGRKGGKGGGGEARTPVEDPNTLRATNIAQIVDLIGEGPVEGLVSGLQSVYFDETPVKNEDGSFNFEGVRMVARAGYPDQDPIPGLPGVENESDVSVQVRKDTPVVRTVNNPEADALRIRVHVPRLTYQDKENGDLKGHRVEFAFDIRTEGATSWSSLGVYTIEGKTTSPYQRSYRLPLSGDGPWGIRVRRISEDDPGALIANELYWASYTTIIDAKLSYPDSALVGIEADARQFGSAIPQRAYHIRGRILQVPSNYDPIARTYSGMWDGTFKLAWSNNPAWVYYDALRNSRYGAGQQYVDKWALYEISRYCDELVPDGYGGEEPRFTCNLVLNTRKEAFEVLDSLSSIFRGMTYWASNQVMSVADMPQDPVKLFTRANIVGDFEYSGSAMKARHSAVLISWNDPDDFFRQTIEVVEDSEMIQKVGWNQKDITAIGCSSRGQAHRLGKWTLYTEKYENETLTFTAGSDAYDLRPGDVISVSDPMVTGARLGGRVVRTGTQELLLDSSPDDLDGTWDLDVVMPNGGIETRQVLEFNGDRVTLDSPLPEAPVDGAMWLLRSHLAAPLSFRVLSVSEGDKPLTFEITALKHEPGKYALVEDGQPLPEKSDSLIPKGPVSPPYNITVETYTSLSAGAEQQNLAISWTASDDPRTQQYQVEVKSPSDTSWRQRYVGTGLSFDIADIQGGEWQVRVRGITGMGKPSAWAYRTTNISGLLVPLPPTAVDIEAKTFTVSLRPKGALPGMQWEFWRSNVALDTAMIESNAVLVATSSDLVDSELPPGTTYYYYIRGVNAYGVSDWYPVQATTNRNADNILEVVEGQITETHLFQSLNERIDKIDDPASVVGSVSYQIAEEAEARAAAIQDEANARIADVQAEAAARAAAIQKEQGARAAAIQSESDARTTADNALSSDITNLTSVVDQNIADISSEQRTRADADSALATDITNLQAQVDNDISVSIANERQVRADADSALATDITNLQSTMGDQMDAAIATEQQARTDADGALASDLDSLTARMGAMRRSFTEPFDSGADLWQNYNGGGELSVVEVADSVSGGKVLRIGNNSGNDQAWLIHQEPIPFDPEALYKITARVRTTAGTGRVYLGWAGVANDGVTLVNKSGDNTHSSQHYHAASADTVASEWTVFEGYTQGLGTPAGSGSVGTFGKPSRMHANTRYLRPMILANYSGVAGVTEIDSFVVEVIPADVQAVDASVTAEQQARAQEDEALASSITALETQMGKDINAAVTAEQQARTTADEALAADITALDTRVGDNASAITAEQQARADGDSALASDITTLQSTVDDNTAAIQTEASTRASEDAALASQITTVQTDLDGQISSVQQSLTSDIDAIENTLNAEYTLKLDVDGYVGGMGIANNGKMIDFAIRADRFYVADPGSGQAQVPFAVDNGTVIVPEGHIGPITVGKMTKNDGTPITTAAGLLRADAIDVDNLNVASAATFYGTAQSGNFSPGTSGWRLLQNGNVEFNQGQFNGTVHVGNVSGLGGFATKSSLSYNEVTGTKPPSNADKTSSNTAYDTSRVAGTSASAVRDRANAGNSAKSRVDYWTKPYKTTIDGNKITTGEAYVDTLEIKGQAVTIPVSSFAGGAFSPNRYRWTDIISVTIDPQGAPVVLIATFDMSLGNRYQGGITGTNTVSAEARFVVGGVVAGSNRPVGYNSAQYPNGASSSGTYTVAYRQDGWYGARPIKLQVFCDTFTRSVARRFLYVHAVRR